MKSTQLSLFLEKKVINAQDKVSIDEIDDTTYNNKSTNIQGAKELRQGRGEIHPNRDCKLEELVYHETAMQK